MVNEYIPHMSGYLTRIIKVVWICQDPLIKNEDVLY